MTVNGRLESIERPKKDNSSPTNDLYLIDRGHRLNISREHFEIRCDENGYSLVDRGSACGTRVAGSSIGGDDLGGIVALHDGDIIAVGIADTPFTYRFITFDEFSLVKNNG
jgi:pSer/pThr/pTyr-binding forkhead associated (FHA) protein